MTQQCRRDPNPKWNQANAPNVVTEVPDGKVAIWFRPKSAAPPEDYDYSVPHQSRAGWKVYFLLLCFLSVPLCCIARLVATFLEGV